MKFESRVEYSKPEESDPDKEFRHHRFEIKDGSEVLAAAEVNYYSNPIPFYQITDLYTKFDHQGKGYGSAIMDQVESFLIKRRKPGVLVDASVDTHKDGESFYLGRGWEPVGDLGQMAFNLQDGVDPSVFDNYEMRGQEAESESSPEDNRKKFLRNS